MYNYYNKQSHDAYEKGKTAVNRADIVVAAPSALEALGCEGYDRFDGNVMSLLDRRGLSLWLPFGEKERPQRRQKAPQAEVSGHLLREPDPEGAGRQAG